MVNSSKRSGNNKFQMLLQLTSTFNETAVSLILVFISYYYVTNHQDLNGLKKHPFMSSQFCKF